MRPPRLVLVHPRNADNLVTIAGVMKNFGLSDWVAVSSRTHLDAMTEVLRHHREPSEAAPPLATLRRVDTLAEAIADCTWVVGTTPRSFGGVRRLTAREFAEETTHRHDVTWALVFGTEANGLSNDDIEQCHAISYLPSSAEQPSLNLAQAVMVYAHELFTVRHDEAPTEGPALADDATLRNLRVAVLKGLVGSGFLSHEFGDRHAVSELMASLVRGSLTAQEAALWTAAWRGLAR